MEKLYKIIIIVLISTNICAKENVLYGDINGDKKNEKIVIELSDKSQILSLCIYSVNNQQLFKYNDFDIMPFMYAKIVKFNGGTSARDILFIVVGDCDSNIHVLSYNRNNLSDGGYPPKIDEKFFLKKYVAQVDYCY